MLEDRLCSFAELGETFGLTDNQFKYLQLRDCVTNSFHKPSFWIQAHKRVFFCQGIQHISLLDVVAVWQSSL